jgi:hypothetical protein
MEKLFKERTYRLYFASSKGMKIPTKVSFKKDEGLGPLRRLKPVFLGSAETS